MTETTVTPPPPHGWRTFLIAWASQSVSVIGSALTFFAINVWLAQVRYPDASQKPQLAWAVSGVMVAWVLTTLLVTPLAGAWADRHDRRRTMITANLASAAVTALLAVMLLGGQLGVPSLLALAVAASACGAVHNSSFETSYSMLVPKEKLPRANGMMMTVQSLAGILAPGMAALLISLPVLARQQKLPFFAAGLGRLPDGTAFAVGVDAATFLVAAVVLSTLSIPSPARRDLHHEDGRRKSLAHDVGEGVRYLLRRTPLVWLQLAGLAANFAIAVLVLQPLIVKFRLSADAQARGFTFETALALVSTVSGLGGVTGGLVVSAWGGMKRRRVFGVLGSLAVMGLAMVAYGSTHALYAAAAAMFVLEGMVPFVHAHAQAIWQAQVPHELQGRVFAVRRLISGISWPASAALAGALAARFDPGIIVVVAGAFLCVCMAAGWASPQLRRVEDREWLEERARERAVSG